VRGARKVEKEPLRVVRALEVEVLKPDEGVIEDLEGVTSIALAQVEASTLRSGSQLTGSQSTSSQSRGSQSSTVGRCEEASIETQGRTAKDAEAKEQFYIALCGAETSTWKILRIAEFALIPNPSPQGEGS